MPALPVASARLIYFRYLGHIAITQKKTQGIALGYVLLGFQPVFGCMT